MILKKYTAYIILPRLWPIASTLLVALTLSTQAHGFSAQAPAGRTGAPPRGNTCAACHSGSGGGGILLEYGDGLLTYEPGQAYSLKLSVEDTGQSRFGFSMTAVESDTQFVGAGTWTAGEYSTVYDMGAHIGHVSAPFVDDGITFEMQWTAPDFDVGPIVFYAAANAANGDFSNGPEDNVYTTQLTILPAGAIQGFFDESPVVDGWRNTGEGYDEIEGIGWIQDTAWPWYFTYAHGEETSGDWIYVFTELGDRSGFWAYNYTGSYYFYSSPIIGWFYSFKPGAEGWQEYRF